jgi:hypothetical protein
MGFSSGLHVDMAFADSLMLAGPISAALQVPPDEWFRTTCEAFGEDLLPI